MSREEKQQLADRSQHGEAPLLGALSGRALHLVAASQLLSNPLLQHCYAPSISSAAVAGPYAPLQLVRSRVEQIAKECTELSQLWNDSVGILRTQARGLCAPAESLAAWAAAPAADAVALVRASGPGGLTTHTRITADSFTILANLCQWKACAVLDDVLEQFGSLESSLLSVRQLGVMQRSQDQNAGALEEQQSAASEKLIARMALEDKLEADDLALRDKLDLIAARRLELKDRKAQLTDAIAARAAVQAQLEANVTARTAGGDAAGLQAAVDNSTRQVAEADARITTLRGEVEAAKSSIAADAAAQAASQVELVARREHINRTGVLHQEQAGRAAALLDDMRFAQVLGKDALESSMAAAGFRPHQVDECISFLHRLQQLHSMRIDLQQVLHALGAAFQHSNTCLTAWAEAVEHKAGEGRIDEGMFLQQWAAEHVQRPILEELHSHATAGRVTCALGSPGLQAAASQRAAQLQLQAQLALQECNDKLQQFKKHTPANADVEIHHAQVTSLEEQSEQLRFDIQVHASAAELDGTSRAASFTALTRTSRSGSGSALMVSSRFDRSASALDCTVALLWNGQRELAAANGAAAAVRVSAAGAAAPAPAVVQPALPPDIFSNLLSSTQLFRGLQTLREFVPTIISLRALGQGEAQIASWQTFLTHCTSQLGVTMRVRAESHELTFALRSVGHIAELWCANVLLKHDDGGDGSLVTLRDDQLFSDTSEQLLGCLRGELGGLVARVARTNEVTNLTRWRAAFEAFLSRGGHDGWRNLSVQLNTRLNNLLQLEQQADEMFARRVTEQLALNAARTALMEAQSYTGVAAFKVSAAKEAQERAQAQEQNFAAVQTNVGGITRDAAQAALTRHVAALTQAAEQLATYQNEQRAARTKYTHDMQHYIAQLETQRITHTRTHRFLGFRVRTETWETKVDNSAAVARANNQIAEASAGTDARLAQADTILANFRREVGVRRARVDAQLAEARAAQANLDNIGAGFFTAQLASLRALTPLLDARRTTADAELLAQQQRVADAAAAVAAILPRCPYL